MCVCVFVFMPVGGWDSRCTPVCLLLLYILPVQAESHTAAVAASQPCTSLIQPGFSFISSLNQQSHSLSLLNILSFCSHCSKSPHAWWCVRLCVCSCLYKYSSLFHSVDSYFTERNSNITAPLRTDKAITRYVSFIKHSSILPQQSAVLSNASSALLQAAPSQTSALS